MAVLEKINSLKAQGLSETQIINTLREEGISPMDINEGLSQSKIKAAVTDEYSSSEMQPSIMAQDSGQQQYMTVPDSAKSISAPAPSSAQVPQTSYVQQYSKEQPVQDQQQYSPQAADQQAYDQTQASPAYDQQQYEGQAYAPQAASQQYAYPQDQQQNYYTQAVDLETVKDISKQQVEEALKKVNADLDSLNKIKTDLKFEIQDMQNRLMRVESMMKDVQSSVVRKMAEHGDSIQSLAREIRATQQSFSKILNPVLDKKRGIKTEDQIDEEEPMEPIKEEKESEEDKEESPAIKSRSKKEKAKEESARAPPGASFEDYFR